MVAEADQALRSQIILRTGILRIDQGNIAVGGSKVRLMLQGLCVLCKGLQKELVGILPTL